jgi:subtilisin family serine protease
MTTALPVAKPKAVRQQRYFITTPDESPINVYSAAMSKGMRSPKKYRLAENVPNVMTAALSEKEVERLLKFGAEVTPSGQHQPVAASLERVYRPLASHPHSMIDVMQHVKAPAAWKLARGENVHVAIIDTGVCGTDAEFPAWKQSPHRWSHDGSDAWTDDAGHGSMTAAAAAATNSDGGRYNGVAPDASIIACKTTFDDTEIFDIYDYLISLVKSQKVGRLVTNNSYGDYRCSEVTVPPQVTRVIRTAVDAGIVIVFAAGNNHVVVCHNDPSACEKNTIWGLNSLDEVLSVGTVNHENRMSDPPAVSGDYSHRDSSRGPGQFAKKTTKPDCVAPTYGEVVWGCGYQAMEWWGTSGAAPQVAGLAALVLEREPGLSPEQVYDRIRGTCTDIGLGRECAGHGLINCEMAVGGP